MMQVPLPQQRESSGMGVLGCLVCHVALLAEDCRRVLGACGGFVAELAGGVGWAICRSSREGCERRVAVVRLVLNESQPSTRSDMRSPEPGAVPSQKSASILSVAVTPVDLMVMVGSPKRAQWPGLRFVLCNLPTA